MIDLAESVVDEIFERALKLQQKLHSPNFIKFFLKYNKTMSIFDLLE
jgi:hypothetical protein